MLGQTHRELDGSRTPLAQRGHHCLGPPDHTPHPTASGSSGSMGRPSPAAAKTERLLNLTSPALHPPAAGQEPDPHPRPAVCRQQRRGVRPDVRAGQGRAARAGRAAAHRDHRRLLRRRDGLPDRPARVRAAADRLHRRRARRHRAGQPSLVTGQPGRPGRPGAAQAAGGRGGSATRRASSGIEPLLHTTEPAFEQVRRRRADAAHRSASATGAGDGAPSPSATCNRGR